MAKNKTTTIHIICCNDGMMSGVLGDALFAEEEMQRLKAEHFKKQYKSQDDYDNIFFWHIHEMDCVSRGENERDKA